MSESPEAVLLVGPTGSGKTPLGRLLETRGLRGRPCAHFDFGDNLRRAVAREGPGGSLSQEDLERLRSVLETSALLEDDDFPIAERIVRSFLARRLADGRTWVVLNGLPRHRGQAVRLAPILDVRSVVVLQCGAETVVARIATNAGGDRTHRVDDDLAAIRRKLATFAGRTAPLVDHYRAAGAEVVSIDVTADMTPERTWAAVERAFD